MKRAICEITGKIFDCKNCDAFKGDVCPSWELDDAISKYTKGIREYLTKGKNENTISK
jgi:hypothetical protein